MILILVFILGIILYLVSHSYNKFSIGIPPHPATTPATNTTTNITKIDNNVIPKPKSVAQYLAMIGVTGMVVSSLFCGCGGFGACGTRMRRCNDAAESADHNCFKAVDLWRAANRLRLDDMNTQGGI